MGRQLFPDTRFVGRPRPATSRISWFGFPLIMPGAVAVTIPIVATRFVAVTTQLFLACDVQLIPDWPAMLPSGVLVRP